MRWQSVFFRLFLISAVIGGFGKLAVAATIEARSGDNCRLKLSGPIESGDFEKFLAAAKIHFPGSDGESSHRDVVCLDSPGGSLSEGVKFARHFYTNGVGTYIEGGDECYSACAIMFMMGLSEGPEVRFANRKMDVAGTLGFHRPYFAPKLEGRVGLDASEIAALYDSAMQSALDLIEIGNRKSPWSNAPMMMADLVQQMLTHVGDDMFLIDNIDRASRFQIEIVGMPKLGKLTEEQAFYACENGLQWQIGLTNEDILYTPEIAAISANQRRVKPITSNDGRAAFEIEGLATGYALEGCVVAETDSGIEGCGIDEYTGVTIGGGQCTTLDFKAKLEAMDPMTRYNPATKLVSLRATGASNSPKYRCTILRDQKIVESNPCSSEVRILNDNEWHTGLHAEFTWPSGAKTILRRNDTRTEINGVATSLRKDRQFGGCYVNAKTGNEFCFSKVE